MSSKVEYQFQNRDATLTQIMNAGKIIVEDATIDLDENGIPTNCFVIADDAPPAEPDLLAAADQRILDLEYENLMLQEGLA